MQDSVRYCNRPPWLQLSGLMINKSVSPSLFLDTNGLLCMMCTLWRWDWLIVSNRNSDENKNRIHIHHICRVSSSKNSILLNAARWVNCPQWEWIGTWAKLLKCSWAAFKNKTQPVVFSSKEAQRLEVRSVGGGFAPDGAPHGNSRTPTQVCLPALANEPSELEYSREGAMLTVFYWEETGWPAWTDNIFDPLLLRAEEI